MNAKKQFSIALYFFFGISILGLILRLVPVYPLGINFSNFLHAHSHVAFLGWLHGGFISLISYIFLRKKLNTRYFRFIYLFTIFNIAGMYISFPIQGYKLFSIIFLSLFLISTYLFLSYFFKHKQDIDIYPATYKFTKAGLWLMFVSSLSPWSLVFILKMFGKESNFYKYDIFYYLHFQYNGWFLFAMIAITMYLLERRNIRLCHRQTKLIYGLLLIAVFFGYFSNTLWANPGIFYNILAFIGGFAEIAAILYLFRLLVKYRIYIKQPISDFSYRILKIILFSLMLKSVLQFVGSFQYYADLSYLIRDFIIGYLHLIMLGIFTPFLLIIAKELNFIELKSAHFYTFYFGFLITEAVIFFRATLLWFGVNFSAYIFNLILFIFTLLMFTGISLITSFKNKI